MGQPNYQDHHEAIDPKLHIWRATQNRDSPKKLMIE